MNGQDKSQTALKHMEKVFAYITGPAGLLVFKQPQYPDAGVQVPAGTVDPGEALHVAVLREVFEETGLEASAFTHPPEYIGEASFDARAWGKQELHRRHFFHLNTKQDLPKTWQHTEHFGVDTPVIFEFSWWSIERAIGQLIFQHDLYLGQIKTAR